jgi:hypothetical protein
MNHRRAGAAHRAVVLALALGAAGGARAADDAAVTGLLLPSPRMEEIKKMGPAVLPAMARLYERSGPADRATIANAFYVLGWKSADAKRALMQDAHTDDSHLRLQVQWALGRVSNDADVVDVLLDNMQHDGNPLFRDKAACALAHDQIHLTEGQKLHLYARLITSLRDPKPQGRDIAIKVLVIHTGQNKGFDPNAPMGQREQSIRAWEDWLAEYRANQ